MNKIHLCLLNWRSQNSAKTCVLHALLAPTLFGIAYFGFNAAIVVICSVISCYVAGILFAYLNDKRLRFYHPGSILTGLLIGLTCGGATPIYMLIVGALVAEFIGKLVLTTKRGNVFNPAVLGRSAVAVLETIDPIEYADLSTGASVLFKEAGGLVQPEYLNAFLGFAKGSIGETSALILLLAGFIMLRYVVLKWQGAVAMIITVPILVFLLPASVEVVGHAPWVGDPLLFLIGSPTLLLALFFVTDPATSPNTIAGCVLFGICVGIFAVLGKLYTSIAGVEMYGILLMNVCVPLLNKLSFKTQTQTNADLTKPLNGQNHVSYSSTHSSKVEGAK